MAEVWPIEQVVLVGFMGSGKTSVGAELALRLGWPHLDTDEIIERAERRKISDIFQNSGEQYFRTLEARATGALAAQKEVLISTGGGWMMDPRLPAMLRPAATLVWLEVSAEQALHRLGGTEARDCRPLLASPDPEATVRRMLAEREPIYRTADHAISTDGLSVADVATEIEMLLRSHQ
ncbi:MAG TPA: shikimate kinase [Longimicrobiaceae bacterium]|nr:shikimate kinase [Longimicrobiaceae bacterium]